MELWFDYCIDVQRAWCEEVRGIGWVGEWVSDVDLSQRQLLIAVHVKELVG